MTSSTISLRERKTGCLTGSGRGPGSQAVLATVWLEKQTRFKHKEHQTKCLCLESRLKSCMLFRRRGMQSSEESTVVRLDPPCSISLKFLLWHLCMQRWQPKMMAVCREDEEKCCVDSTCLSERSLKPPLSARPRQGSGSSSEITHGSPDFCPLSPLSSAAAVLLQPQLQYVHKHPSWSLQIHHSELCTLSDLYKTTKGDISLLPQESLCRKAGTQQALPVEDTSPISKGILQP